MDDEAIEDETTVLIRSGPAFEGGNTPNDNGEEKCDKRLSMDEAIEKAGFGRFQYLMVMVMGWANSSDAVEMMSISFILPLASCELKASGTDMGILTAMGFAGMMVGGYFWGAIADVKGRINSLILCQACNALFIIGSALSQNLWFLMLMRFCSGLGVGGTSPLIFVYIVEFLPARHRGRMTAILSFCFMIGQIIIAGLAWYILPHTEWTWYYRGFIFNNWRLFMLVSSLPAITSFLLFILFPKSPRYLMQINQMAEAKAVLRKVHGWNKITEPYDDNYIIEMEATVNNVGSVGYIIKKMLKNTWNLVSDPKIRPRFLYSCVISFCLAFAYYGLTMWFPTLIEKMESSNATSVCDATAAVANKTQCDNSDQIQVYTVAFINSASSLPGHVFYFIFIDMIGRKAMLGISMLMTAVSVFCIWLVSSRIGSIVASCAFTAITIISWDTMSLLMSELFPTKIRSTARGVLSSLCNRLAAIIGSLIFGVLITTHCAVPILLIAGLLAFGAIVTYKLPNMRTLDIN